MRIFVDVLFATIASLL